MSNEKSQTPRRRAAAAAPRRQYRQTRRADAQARTRQRIVEAIVALHEEVGPLNTTISAIARRAGVERLTVYRHFPDELSQFVACSEHWRTRHPPPDPSSWASIDDPDERTRTALDSLYTFYRRGQPMLSNIFRDVDRVPDLRPVVQPFADYLEHIADTIVRLQPGVADPSLQRAAARHAAQFSTWQSLAGQGIAHRRAVELMVRFIAAAARG